MCKPHWEGSHQKNPQESKMSRNLFFCIILVPCACARKKKHNWAHFCSVFQNSKISPWWPPNQGEHLDRFICRNFQSWISSTGCSRDKRIIENIKLLLWIKLKLLQLQKCHFILDHFFCICLDVHFVALKAIALCKIEHQRTKFSFSQLCFSLQVLSKEVDRPCSVREQLDSNLGLAGVLWGLVSHPTCRLCHHICRLCHLTCRLCPVPCYFWTDPV